VEDMDEMFENCEIREENKPKFCKENWRIHYVS